MREKRSLPGKICVTLNNTQSNMTGQISSMHNHASSETNKAFPCVSIIIPSHKDSPTLQKCLDALMVQSFPSTDFEIIVVNNAPDKPMQVNYPRNNLTITQESKPGSYAARNKGISMAKGEILGFCDSDCVPDKDWILNAVEFFKNNRTYSRIAGKVNLTSQNADSPNIYELYESVFAFRQREYVKQGGAVTANMFTYKCVFDQIGLFDHNLMSGGDLIWGKKAQQMGYKIACCENVVVSHPARHTFSALAQKSRRVVSGMTELNQADLRRNSFSAIKLGLIMLKPPIKSASMIAGRRDISFWKKIRIYGLDYIFKIIQLYEFIRVQSNNKSLQ